MKQSQGELAELLNSNIYLSLSQQVFTGKVLGEPSRLLAHSHLLPSV